MSTLPTGRWEPTTAMAPEDQLAVARLRQVGPPEALSDDAWDRIHSSLFVAPRRASGRAKLAVLGTLGFGLAVAAGLHLSGRRTSPAERPVALPPLEVTGVIAPPSTAPILPPTIEPVATEPVAVKPVRHRSRAPSPGVAPSAAEEALDAESQQVGKALHQLRIEKNPSAALETLGDYRRRFPGGMLTGEARLAELDANLALGRAAEALQLLDGAPPPEGGQPREAALELLRAELLVSLGRCGEARVALDRRLAASSGPARLCARALYLRALCAARDGDLRASQSDLEDYLRRFPDQSDHRAVAEALQRMSAP